MATKKLADTIGRSGSPVYETEEFRDVLLLHMDLIRKRVATSSIEITQDEADKWRGDFYGLLQSKGVRPYMFWLITVFNGLTNSGAYNSDFLDLQTPDMEYVEKLVDIHNTVHI